MNSPFTVRTYPFSEADFKKWVLDNDYHCVYLLENGKQAYIGETLVARERAARHARMFRRIAFERMHIISSDLMEETPAKHFERLLIRLMKVDGLFQVLNGNKGNRTHYRREKMFELHFDRLWEQLLEKKLVKAVNFRFILNSDAYKYSPYTTLTPEQNQALTAIKNVLQSGETDPYDEHYQRRPIWINGDAGTGKTVVATSLFHFLRNDPKFRNKRIALVVANVQMRSVLQQVFAKTGEGLRKEDVISPIALTRQPYDIVICDEVHALRRDENLWFYARHFREGNRRLGFDDTHDELDWILKQSEYQILFYDKKQCVKHSDIRDEYIEKRILKNPLRDVRPIHLKRQMRIKAGRSYVRYIYDLLYQKARRKRVFGNYDFKLFSSFAMMREAIAAKEESFGLSRLCSGYAWEWISRADKSLYDIRIEDVPVLWNDNGKLNWIKQPDTKDEMGSMYTLRGLDMNYAGVVIGPDLRYDAASGRIVVDTGSLYSQDVKKNASAEEVRKYVLNSYALLLTRAIEGTYVYVCDKPLREYLRPFIEPARG